MQHIRLINKVVTLQVLTLEVGSSWGVVECANLGGGCHICVVGALVYIPQDAIESPTKEELDNAARLGRTLQKILRGEK